MPSAEDRSLTAVLRSCVGDGGRCALDSLPPSLALLASQYFSSASVMLRSLASFLPHWSANGSIEEETALIIRGHVFEVLGVPPGPAQAPIAQGDKDANGNHAGIAGIFLVAGLVDEGAEPGVVAVDKVDEVVADGVQARGQRLVLDAAIELDGVARGALPDDGVSGLDVEVDEEEGGEGGPVVGGGGGGGGAGGRYGEGDGGVALSPSLGSHGAAGSLSRSCRWGA